MQHIVSTAQIHCYGSICLFYIGLHNEQVSLWILWGQKFVFFISLSLTPVIELCIAKESA